MHDLDRVSIQKRRRPSIDRGAGPLDEAEVMDAAAELLEAEEIGSFVRRIVQRTGQRLRTSFAPAFSAALTSALQPVIDGVAQVLAPDEPTPPNSPELGLELEGLSAEDREFEVAKQLVRLTSRAAAIAASAPPQVSPADVARRAAVEAAKQFAPGFVGRLLSGPGPNRASAPEPPIHSSGRWYQRGGKIILVGV